MREVDSDQKRTTGIHSIIRLTFLLLALIFLATAAFLQGKEHISTKVVLIIIGACMLTAGVITFLLKRPAQKQSKLSNMGNLNVGFESMRDYQGET